MVDFHQNLVISVFIKIKNKYRVQRSKISNFEARPILTPIFVDGKQVYQLPTLNEVRDYCKQQLDTLWDEVKRFEYPHKYYVDLSPSLWEVRHNLLDRHDFND